MIINNAQSFCECVHADDLFICTFGYEQRSVYLYEKITGLYPAIASLTFLMDDYEQYPHTVKKAAELREKQSEVFVQKYEDYAAVQERIIERVNALILERDALTVHIDYSSMPRSWYCKLPILLNSVIRPCDKVYFWYAEGDYPEQHEVYPSAGIESFSFYAGKPSLRIDNKRVHVVALGYDVIRTQAILSITDPSYLVACYAYNPKREGFLERLKQVNEPVLSRAAVKVPLHVEDFGFMVSKLCEIAKEFTLYGDVVLIPDGPKPLIFALSLVPDLIRNDWKEGIACLHISRNKDHFEVVDVTPNGIVHGFVIMNDDSQMVKT